MRHLMYHTWACLVEGRWLAAQAREEKERQAKRDREQKGEQGAQVADPTISRVFAS